MTVHAHPHARAHPTQGIPSAAATPGRWQRLLLHWIEVYQAAYSGRPSPCRFTPSCSHYAHDALTLHGTGRGLWLTIRRLARCRPLGPSGFDPVPDPEVHGSS